MKTAENITKDDYHQSEGKDKEEGKFKTNEISI